MTFEVLRSVFTQVRESAFFRDTVITGTVLLILICVLALLLGITALLRIFFKRHPIINRAHRILIYLLTMAGVVALLIAGVIGVMLPVIPGLVFIFLALLLMRRYHRWKWVDKQLAKVTRAFKRTSYGKRYFAWRRKVREEHLRKREERLQEKRVEIQEKLNKVRDERRTKGR